jgi:phosphoglycolate phosphatase
MDKLEIPENERPKNLNPFIGPPLRKSFMNLFGMSPDEAENATIFYREYYKVKGVYDFDIYPGIPEVIKNLKDTGFSISLVTSKAEEYAKLILDSTSFANCFDTVSGCEIDGKRSEKSELISYTLSKLNLHPNREVLMIGDRYHDIRGAKAIGISSAAVLYGYGTHEELHSEDPDLFIEHPDSLLQLKFIENR